MDEGMGLNDFNNMWIHFYLALKQITKIAWQFLFTLIAFSVIMPTSIRQIVPIEAIIALATVCILHIAENFACPLWETSQLASSARQFRIIPRAFMFRTFIR